MINYIIKIACMGLALFCVCLQQTSWAEDDVMESISGADRSFTYGYVQAERVRGFERDIADRDAKEAAKKKPLAGEDVGGGGWNFYKSFRTATLYDSNLFYSRNDTKDDVLFIYSPSVGAALGKPGVSRVFLKAFYDLSYVDYVEDQKFSRFNQIISMEAGLHESKFDLTFQNTLKPASARETGERTELATTNSNRVITWTDSFGVNGSYHWTPKVDLTGNYNYTIVYFPVASNRNNPGVNLFSNQKNSFSPGISYKLTPKITLLTNASVGVTDYFKGGGFSSRNYGLSAGLKYRLNSKTDISLESGYSWTDYLLDGIPLLDGPHYGAIIRRQITNKISLTFSASQSVGEAFDFSQFSLEPNTLKTVSSDYRLDLKWQVIEPMILTAFAAMQNDSRDGLFSMPDPENTSRISTQQLEDQVYTWGLNCSWKTKSSWSYFASVESLTKFSSFKSLQYDDQRIAGSVRMDF